jgi:3-oxoacyl-(acyl-carrier-protein) synthase
VTTPGIAIASAGAVTALGLGKAKVLEAIDTNVSALRPCSRFSQQAAQTIPAGVVPEHVWQELRERHSCHRDAQAFLLSDAALREAESDLLQCGFTTPENPSAAPAQASLEGFRDLVPAHRRALVLSTTKAEVSALENVYRQQPVSDQAQRHIFPALLAQDLAKAHDVAGPVQCVSVACVSGLLALQQGVLLLREDKADLVLVVGVDLLSDFVMTGFMTLKSLDPAGCRPFDAERRGLSLGEAAAAVVLVRRDWLAQPALVVSGWGSSNDANHLTGPSRDGAGLALAINRALRTSRRVPRDIDLVHTHGTGTPYNDAMEGMALKAVFGSHLPPFSSSKGLFGHTLGAAGVLETIVCLLSAQRQVLPGTPGLRKPDSLLPAPPLDKPKPVSTLRRILKVNAGFGGTNAALLLEWDEV